MAKAAQALVHSAPSACRRKFSSHETQKCDDVMVRLRVVVGLKLNLFMDELRAILGRLHSSVHAVFNSNQRKTLKHGNLFLHILKFLMSSSNHMEPKNGLYNEYVVDQFRVYRNLFVSFLAGGSICAISHGCADSTSYWSSLGGSSSP